MSIVDEIFDLFAHRGSAAYLGEPVTQLEHALQTAWQGGREGAPDTLIAAALLHDLGHLLHGQSEYLVDYGIDGRHEELGATWLSRQFPASVTEPVRLHVAAKRYLCAVDTDYQGSLSAASLHSLVLQGGPFSAAEVQAFITLSYAREAVQLRGWDEMAKVVGAKTPDWEAYRPLLEKVRLKEPIIYPTQDTQKNDHSPKFAK